MSNDIAITRLCPAGSAVHKIDWAAYLTIPNTETHPDLEWAATCRMVDRRQLAFAEDKISLGQHRLGCGDRFPCGSDGFR